MTVWGISPDNKTSMILMPKNEDYVAEVYPYIASAIGEVIHCQALKPED